jgi:hypothetical protein
VQAEKMPPDPWLRDYVYSFPSRKSGKSFDVICLGPDGVPSDDDTVLSR